MTSHLVAIITYPVKSLPGTALAQAALAPDAALPDDRRFAVTHGASRFDGTDPHWMDKRQFLNLMANAKLGSLGTEWDTATATLTLTRDGKPVAKGTLTTPVGRDLITQFLGAYLGQDDTRGKLRIVEVPGTSLSDIEPDWLSIINLTSLADVERVTRQPVDPARFRGNLYVRTEAPWQEFGWVGQRIRIGDAILQVEERIGRCAAINVEPGTGKRDLNVMKALVQGFGEASCGVYARVVTPGHITEGASVILA